MEVSHIVQNVKWEGVIRIWQACKEQHWIDAINKEMKALYDNDTWEITDLTKGRKSIGYNQKEGIDFDETFSLVVKLVTVRCLINLTVQNSWPLYQLDANNAFLYDGLSKTMYMDLPNGLFSPNDKRYLGKAKKQKTLSKSSAEAKYRAIASATSKTVWILKILQDLNWEHFIPAKVYCDNQAAIKIAANHVFHERTKYLEIDLHFVRDKIISGVIETKKISSAEQTTNVLTKDDVIMTTEWSDSDLDNIIRILYVFYLALGLLINIHKSNIYDIGVLEEVLMTASNSGCAPGCFLFTYLSLPIRSNMTHEMVLDSLERAYSTFFGERVVSTIKVSVNGTWAKIVGSFNLLHSKDIIAANSISFPSGLWHSHSLLERRLDRFETYVKAKDIDLWHIILNGDFPPVAKNEITQVLEVVPFEEQSNDLKKKLAKNNKANMILYNALPKKEYERIFMCKTAKDIWKLVLIIHQALDEGFSSKNYIRKFFSALHPKWRAKVTTIEESKDLSSLALDELIGNLKVHEVIMGKDSKIYRGKKERVKSIALKAKKESSDDETLTSRSDDEEYAMASDSENDTEDKINDETYLMAQSSSK
ncbi:zf-CCHC domain-containing protein, partial [Tanacetum coccineum]